LKSRERDQLCRKTIDLSKISIIVIYVVFKQNGE
jgi:hypothetical protein